VLNQAIFCLLVDLMAKTKVSAFYFKSSQIAQQLQLEEQI
jgi:hypothetical protein